PSMIILEKKKDNQKKKQKKKHHGGYDKNKKHDNKKHDFKPGFDNNIFRYEQTLRKVKFRTSKGDYSNLWSSTNYKLKEYVSEIINPIINNQFDEKVWNNYFSKNDIKDRKIKDPVTNRITDKYYTIFIGDKDQNVDLLINK